MRFAALSYESTHGNVTNRLVVYDPFILDVDICSKPFQGVDHGYSAWIKADVFQNERRTGQTRRGHEEKSRRRYVARHDKVACLQYMITRNGDSFAGIGCLLDQFTAKPARHSFRMIAGRRRLNNRGFAICE